MKIAYVITRSDVMGGASIHLLDLASKTQEAGHDVVIYVGGHGIFLDRAESRSLICVPVHFLKREINPFYDFLCFLELRFKLKKLKPDIVHLHSSKAGIIGRLVSKSLRIPSIFTAHGWAFTEGVPNFRRKIYLVIEKIMARLASHIITVSDFDRELALNLQVGSKDMITSIHNGIPDIPCFKKRVSDSAFVRFIMVARFDHPKDQKLLINAFSIIKETNWRLEFIGSGPLYLETIKYAKSLGLNDKILFSGECTDVHNRLSNSDVFCLISNWEGLPLTIIEAMRAGLPVLASLVGGVSETIINGETGYLVERGDAEKIAFSLEALLKNESLRLSQGANGRLFYEREFMFEKMFFKTLEVYQNVLDKRL